MKAKYIKKIVGLVGKKHSGKDTFYANCLELYLAGEIKLLPYRLAFADALKEELAKQCNTTVEQINKDKKAYRSRLQDVSIERRRQDEEYWINKLAQKMIKYELQEANTPSLVIVTDVRFLNEAAFIHKLNGKLIRITRPSTDNDIDKHVSETELTLIDYDYPLSNTGSNNLYKHQILDTLKQLKLTE